MTDYVDLIRLTRNKEVQNWKDLSDDELQEAVKDILIRFDIYFQYLGVKLMRFGDDADPDADYTPCEHQMHMMAKLFGLDYNDDINDEAYRRIKVWRNHLEEVRKARGIE